MPIRFRCVYCNKLLGIARRKAGAIVNCPHCAEKLIVPTPEPADMSAPAEEERPPAEEESNKGPDIDAYFNFDPDPEPPPSKGTTEEIVPPPPRSKGSNGKSKPPPRSKGSTEGSQSPKGSTEESLPPLPKGSTEEKAVAGGLFERGDFDALLLGKPTFRTGGELAPLAPVPEFDSIDMDLEEGPLTRAKKNAPPPLVSPPPPPPGYYVDKSKAVWLVILGVVLMAVAFAAGLMVGKM